MPWILTASPKLACWRLVPSVAAFRGGAWGDNWITRALPSLMHWCIDGFIDNGHLEVIGNFRGSGLVEGILTSRVDPSRDSLPPSLPCLFLPEANSTTCSHCCDVQSQLRLQSDGANQIWAETTAQTNPLPVARLGHLSQQQKTNTDSQYFTYLGFLSVQPQLTWELFSQAALKSWEKIIRVVKFHRN